MPFTLPVLHRKGSPPSPKWEKNCALKRLQEPLDWSSQKQTKGAQKHAFWNHPETSTYANRKTPLLIAHGCEIAASAICSGCPCHDRTFVCQLTPPNHSRRTLNRPEDLDVGRSGTWQRFNPSKESMNSPNAHMRVHS